MTLNPKLPLILSNGYMGIRLHRLCLDLFGDQIPLALQSSWNVTKPCQLELIERLLDYANLQTPTNDNDDVRALHFQTICSSGCILGSPSHANLVSAASGTALLINLIFLLPNPRTRRQFWKKKCNGTSRVNFKG